MARIRWEVRHRAEVRDWAVYRGSTLFGVMKRKADTVQWAADVCREALQMRGELSELTIKRMDGTIQDKRTYGRDPRSTKG